MIIKFKPDNIRNLFIKKLKFVDNFNSLIINKKDSFKNKINNYNKLIKNKSKELISKVDNNSFNFLNSSYKDLFSKIGNKIFQKENDVFLQQDTFWIRSVSWGIISTTIFGISWLAIAKTEEIIVVTGKIVPLGEVQNIKMPMGGNAKNILVKEGDYVEYDQLLVELNNDSNLARQNTILEALELKRSEQEISNKFMNEERKILTTARDFNKDILERLRILHDEGAVSSLDYLKQQLTYNEADNDLSKSVIKQDQQNFIYRREIAELLGQYTENRITLDQMEIRAPLAGIVFDLKPTNKGYSAQMTETILKIVPLDKLQAKIDIPSSDIGFIRKGMEVDISIDSFPASDFGVISGKISRISSDALKPDQNNSFNTYNYPATIELDSQKLRLKNGDLLSLKVGMSLNANIKLRKVSYLQLLLTTFKDKTNSLKEI
tara:strand:- start:1002 stop:2303 length:1302 start_codon:yes stop_codon:yes gene_type:complete